MRGVSDSRSYADRTCEARESSGSLKDYNPKTEGGEMRLPTTSTCQKNAKLSTRSYCRMPMIPTHVRMTLCSNASFMIVSKVWIPVTGFKHRGSLGPWVGWTTLLQHPSSPTKPKFLVPPQRGRHCPHVVADGFPSWQPSLVHDSGTYPKSSLMRLLRVKAQGLGECTEALQKTSSHATNGIQDFTGLLNPCIQEQWELRCKVPGERDS